MRGFNFHLSEVRLGETRNGLALLGLHGRRWLEEEVFVRIKLTCLGLAHYLLLAVRDRDMWAVLGGLRPLERLLLLLLARDARSDLPLRECAVVDIAPTVVSFHLVVGGLSLAEPLSQHHRALVDGLSVLTHEVDHGTAVALQVLQVVDFPKSILLARRNPCASSSVWVLIVRHLLIYQLLSLRVV